MEHQIIEEERRYFEQNGDAGLMVVADETVVKCTCGKQFDEFDKAESHIRKRQFPAIKHFENNDYWLIDDIALRGGASTYLDISSTKANKFNKLSGQLIQKLDDESLYISGMMANPPNDSDVRIWLSEA